MQKEAASSPPLRGGRTAERSLRSEQSAEGLGVWRGASLQGIPPHASMLGGGSVPQAWRGAQREQGVGESEDAQSPPPARKCPSRPCGHPRLSSLKTEFSDQRHPGRSSLREDEVSVFTDDSAEADFAPETSFDPPGLSTDHWSLSSLKKRNPEPWAPRPVV